MGDACSKALGRELVCRRCGEKFVSSSAGRGRPPAYCSDECRAPPARVAKPRGTCCGCAGPLGRQRDHGRPRKHCSSACRIKTQRQKAKSSRISSDVICRACGQQFTRSIKKGGLKLFCSETCKHERYKRNCEICESVFCTSNVERKTCGTACGRELLERNRYRVFASAADRWRHQGNLRRAKTAGAERFSPREIFERDGWCCGICGQKVDEGLAHPHPLSASLDHVIPISAGGAHARRNVQCSHLGCNSRKSADLGAPAPVFA